VRSDSIAILIPAFRAAATLPSVVRKALAHGAEVLVVDDGSDDGSGESARAAGARVIRHPENLGKGAALASGFNDLLSGSCDAIVTLDADGQHDPREISKFVQLWLEKKPDIIVGARAGAFELMSPARRLGNNFSTAAVKFFRGPVLPDTQCGFRLYSRRYLEEARFSRRRYDAEIEMLMRAAGEGYSVLSLPIATPTPDGRSTSHYRPWVDTIRMCWAVIHYRLFEAKPDRNSDRKPALRADPSSED
jgi:glycosyltransferase involved in cell wall biosynthesis